MIHYFLVHYIWIWGFCGGGDLIWVTDKIIVILIYSCFALAFPRLHKTLITDRGRPYTDTPFVIPPGILKSSQPIGDDPDLCMALNLTFCPLLIYIYIYTQHLAICVSILGSELATQGTTDFRSSSDIVVSLNTYRPEIWNLGVESQQWWQMGIEATKKQPWFGMQLQYNIPVGCLIKKGGWSPDPRAFSIFQ